MSVTGLYMIVFLLVHMYGNLKAFQGQEAFDHYAHWLKEDFLYPLFAHGHFIIVFRATLVLAVILHAWSAASLSRQTISQRGPGYQNKKRQVQTYSARTMRWGGVLILGFIIFHILQFTTQTIQTGFEAGDGAYTMVVASFQQAWLVALYAVLMVLVCMHIRHGFFSAFATLGLNTSAKARRVLNVLAYVVSIGLYVGFMIMPLAVLVGWIGF